MKLNKFIPALFVVFALISCKNEAEKDSQRVVEVESANDITQPDTKKPTIGDVAFNDANVAVVFREYLGLKDALVGTNGAKAGAAAARMVTASKSIDGAEDTVKAAQRVVEASNVEEQRTAFVDVTAAVEGMLAGEIASGTVYKQFCPMAFNNTGASWLSSSSDIMNPYFGDKMLRCGRIEAKIE